jgi:hypothetical protein
MPREPIESVPEVLVHNFEYNWRGFVYVNVAVSFYFCTRKTIGKWINLVCNLILSLFCTNKHHKC